MRHAWKNRAGSLDLHAVVHVRSTGSHEDARPGREAEHEEEREIVDFEVGDVTFCARSMPDVFHALVALLQPEVDGASEDDVAWEAGE